MLTLYQAEWCPFSSAVREIMTELGIDFVARQVEPWPEQREALKAASGSDQIPTLETEDGSFYTGTRAIYAYLRELDGWEYGADHRQRFRDHKDARESDAPGQLVEYFRPPEGVEEAPPEELEVVDVPEESRYELRLGDRMIGEAHYHRRQGSNRITFTHTEVDQSVAGRGLGSKLAAAALADVRRQGLEALPLCPFMSHYIGTHPEVQDLVPENYRRRALAQR
jgi:uncharacterized protein